MKFEGHRIWIALLLAVLIVSGYFFYTFRSNQAQLHDQSIRSLSITQSNLKNSWEAYKMRCRIPPDVGGIEETNISETDSLKKVLNILLSSMPPSDFFDITIITDSSGQVLVTKPEAIIDRMPVGENIQTEEIKLGIIDSELTISGDNYQIFQVPIHLQWDQQNCLWRSENQDSENANQDIESENLNSETENQNSEPDNLKSESEKIILYGALSQENFNQVRWRIPFIAIYFLLSLVILIIASYPVIRILGMGRGDRMTGSQVYQTGLSLILLSLFIGFSISYFASRHEIKNNQSDYVQSLINNVEKMQKAQLSKYIMLLDLFIKVGGEPVNKSNIQYNETIVSDIEGNIQHLWLSSDKKAIEDTLINDLPDLATRHYIKRAVDDNFYHGSHYSYNRGKFENVISKKKVYSNERDHSYELIHAITFNNEIYDAVDTLYTNPIGLKYLIINEIGEVYYRPPSVNTAIFNLREAIHPRQWDEVLVLMQNNDSTETPLQINIYFEGQRFNAFLQKMSTEPLNLKESSWILVFDDPNLLAFRSYSAFMYSAVGYLFLLIIFLAIGLISYAIRPEVYYLSFRRFNQYFFRPSFKKRKENVILCLIISTHILFFIIILNCIDIHHIWLLLLLFGLTVPFIILSRHLLLSDFLQKLTTASSWKFPLSVFAVILLILYFLYHLPVIEFHYLLILLFLLGIQAGWIIFIIWAFNNYPFQIQKKLKKILWLRGISNFIKAFVRNPNQMFSFTFAIWALLIGMIAGYAIHHSAFHYEDKLWELAVEHKTGEPHLHEDNKNHVEHSSRSTNHDHNGHFHTASLNPFLNHFEYWRRQWLFNYTGIDYPVINRYIYAGRSQIMDAFDHDHTEENDHSHQVHHSKEPLTLFLIVLSFLAGFMLLYYLVKILSKRIFLTEYWKFLPDPAPAPKIKNYTYILTPDPENALRELQSGFLKNKKYKILNLAGRSEREKLRRTEASGSIPFGILLKDTDGIALLNADRALRSSDDIENLTDLITIFKQKEKFVLMTGSKSMKDLQESVLSDKDPERDHALLNWMDVTGSFFSSLIPVGYGLKPPEPGKESSGNKYVEKLRREILYGPHTKALSYLVKLADNEAKSGKFGKKEYQRCILNIQRHNKSYYQNLWDQLTFREKQMVNNYANEGFVNYSNIGVVTELLQKGIFRYDDRHEDIRLFNISFCNFATQAVTGQLAKEFKKDKKLHGNVSHLRNAILTIFFLTILGIAIIRPELPQQYIGAISGGLALISSLASVAGKLPWNIPILEK